MMRPDLSLLRMIGYPLLLACALLSVNGCGGANSAFDPVSGTLSIENVSIADSGGTVAAKLISPKGSGPGSGTITISASNPDLVTFTPASRTANSSGDATFSYTTKEVQADTTVDFTVAVGALSLTRQITIPGTGALSLSVTPPGSAEGYGTITASFAGGSKAAGRRISITSDKSANIAFDSTQQLADANGQAVFSCRAVGLATDTTVKFTASTSAQSVSQSALIPATETSAAPVVTDARVNSIAFVSASPASITLKGAGGAGRTETSVVSFIVRDETGQPMAGQTVDFTLDTSVGGLTILPGSAASDSTGTVKTIVNAGVIATPVRVTATVRGTIIAVKSDQLIVSTGLPHQDSLSVSVASRNPEGLDFDNVQVPISVMLADHFGNPVPDGTAVYFTCYGGSIEPSATTANGMATVSWRSQNPRPGNGIAKILVYAIGEESFIDLNGNGVADAGEFADLTEAFLSISGDVVRNPAKDPFIDFNGDGTYNIGDGKFNGVLQGAAFSGAPRSLHVFKNVPLVMSGSDAFVFLSTATIGASASTTDSRPTSITGTITDRLGNTMPKGSTISLSSTAGSNCGGGGGGLTVLPASFTVNDSLTPGGFNTTVSTNCPAGNKGNLIVTVTTPKGIVTTTTFPLDIQ